jgi:hypothetical protein
MIGHTAKDVKWRWPMRSNREDATKYHEKGINVLPIRAPGETYRDRRGKERTSNGKTPRYPWKEYQTRTQTRNEVLGLFPEDKASNVAVIGGAVSGNLLILDFDDLEKYIELHKRQSAFRYLADNTLSDRSRRGRHLYLRTDAPAKRGKNPELGLDILGQGSYAVAPRSVWKRGTQIGEYLFDQWNEILYVSLEELSWLGVKSAPYAFHDYLGLGYTGYRILQGENPENRYASRSEAEQALIVRLVALGEPLEYVQELFRRFAGEHTHYREHSDPVGYLTTSYERAQSYYALHARTFDRMVNNAMRAARETESFRLESDRTVLLVVLHEARRARAGYLDLSVRSLAEAANISHMTATRALHRLQGAGYLTRKHKAQFSSAASYQVDFAKLLHTNTVGGGYDGVYQNCKSQCEFEETAESNPERELGVNAYAWGALNKTGAKIVTYLNRTKGEWSSIGEIQTATGTAYNTVKTKLGMLADWIESAGKHPVKYRLNREISRGDLDRIAQRMGTAGYAEKRKKQHDEDRKSYQTYLRWKEIRKENRN